MPSILSAMDRSLTTAHTEEADVSLLEQARRNRAQSDFDVDYFPKADVDENESTAAAETDSDKDTQDENALEGDGLSDSELDEAPPVRPRLDTYDDYESNDADVPPAPSAQGLDMINMISAQMSLDCMVAAPSNAMLYACYSPQGSPYQRYDHCYAAPMSPMNSVNATMQQQQPLQQQQQPSFHMPMSTAGSAPACLSPTMATSTLKAPPGMFFKDSSPTAASNPAPRPPGSWGASSAAEKAPATVAPPAKKVYSDGTSTTVMLRNLPSFFSRDKLLKLLDDLGFAKRYDFVHLPADMSRLSCLGFGFVNLRAHADALEFFEKAHGFKDWDMSTSRVLDVSWSNPLQGLDAQIQRYRNSAMMHPSVPDQCKPLLFGEDGERLPFPTPTVELRPPRRK